MRFFSKALFFQLTNEIRKKKFCRFILLLFLVLQVCYHLQANSEKIKKEKNLKIKQSLDFIHLLKKGSSK